MSTAYQGRFICDTRGKVIEVVLPVSEYVALRRRAGDHVHGVPQQIELSAVEMNQIALYGKAFEWLNQEPDLYSEADGEPI